mmetsp:Transcript_11074/g.27237  ORF Transcript_11074/g.27237 Transcript_11074/m.27237 type:complete len:120 (-) Transcript_11074:43-402(-)
MLSYELGGHPPGLYECVSPAASSAPSGGGRDSDDDDEAMVSFEILEIFRWGFVSIGGARGDLRLRIQLQRPPTPNCLKSCSLVPRIFSLRNQLFDVFNSSTRSWVFLLVLIQNQIIGRL